MHDRYSGSGLEPVAATADGAVAPGKQAASARLSARGVVQRAASDAAGDGIAGNASAAVARAASSPGDALPGGVRTRFEASLGADLSAVRLHTGSDSATASAAVGARAYTLGSDVHFGAGHYQPDDPYGMHLLAHEVAHTVQQAGGPPVRQDKLEVSAPGDASEREADRAADAMIAGQVARVTATSGAVMRECGPDAPLCVSDTVATTSDPIAPPQAADGANTAYGAATAVGDIKQLGTAAAQADRYVMGPVGAVFSLFNFVNGVNAARKGGDLNQAGMDIGSGGVGFGAGVMTLFEVAVPGLNLLATVTGLAAAGNQAAQAAGAYGTHTDKRGRETNNTFGGSVADTVNDVSKALDFPVLGDAAALLAGGGRAVANTAVAAGFGAVKMSNDIVEGVTNALGGGREPLDPETQKLKGTLNEGDARQQGRRDRPDEAARRDHDAAVASAKQTLLGFWTQGNGDGVEGARRKLVALGEDPGPSFSEVSKRADAKREWDQNVRPKHDQLIAQRQAAYSADDQPRVKAIDAQLRALPDDPGY